MNRNAPAGQPQHAEPFESDDALLESASKLFNLRVRLCKMRTATDAPQNTDALEQAVARKEHVWRERFRASDGTTALGRLSRQHGLCSMESEVVIALVMESLALFENERSGDRWCLPGDRLATCLGYGPENSISLWRVLSPGSRLVESGVISLDDNDWLPTERKVILDPRIVEDVLNLPDALANIGPNAPQEEFLEKLPSLVRAMSGQVHAFDRAQNPWLSRADAFRCHKHAWGLWGRLDTVVRAHPQWGISKLLAEVDSIAERLILALLVARELGYGPADMELFLGKGLAAAAATSESEVQGQLRLLMPGSALDGLVAPASGDTHLVSATPLELAEIEFGLTSRAVELAEIASAGPRTCSNPRVREPLLTLEQLVLNDRAKEAVRMAIAQAEHASTLWQDWGLAKAFPYGRGMTMLFHGPPGTGKTATAEAVASTLEAPILVADYSSLADCYVGKTEKNMVRVFRDARNAGAVLFLDEADSLLRSRDHARYNWELTRVNTMLRQIEQFEGVCILATNLLEALDPALDRRIAVKVRFERPDQKARRELWRKLVPPELPLAEDVDFDTLAEEELTGGEIKNVIMYAARLSLISTTQVASIDQTTIANATRRCRGRLNNDQFGFDDCKR